MCKVLPPPGKREKGKKRGGLNALCADCCARQSCQ